MAVNLSPVGGVAAQFFTNSGAVLTGGKLYTYAAGTTTPQTTYTTSQGNVPWTNPIVLDAAGRVPSGGEIWLTQNASYKFVIKDSNDVLIATYDDVAGISSLTLPIDSSNITYDPPFAGSVATNVEAKLAQYVSVKDFGAVGNGSADDTNAIQNAINAAYEIYFPSGTYRITSTISIPTATIGKILRGAGRGRTIIKNEGSGIGIQSIGNGSTGNWNVVISDLTVKGQTGTTVGIYFDYTYHSQIERVEVSYHGTHGIKIQRGFYNDIRSPWIHNNTQHGIFFGQTSNACNVFGGHVERNGQDNILIYSEGAVARTHGISIFGTTFESAGVVNLEMNDVDECRVYGSYFESQSPDTTTKHVYVTDDSGVSSWCVIDGCNFTGNNATANMVTIYVDRASDTIIQNCSINTGATITANAVRTRFLNNARVDGTIIDNSTTTTMFNDMTASSSPAWYAKNGTSKWQQQVYSDSTGIDFGTGYLRYNFDNLSDAFRWYNLNAGGTQLAVQRFGAYRLWVNPGDGKLYIKGADPTTPTDGTVVGTQT